MSTPSGRLNFFLRLIESRFGQIGIAFGERLAQHVEQHDFIQRPDKVGCVGVLVAEQLRFMGNLGGKRVTGSLGVIAVHPEGMAESSRWSQHRGDHRNGAE